MADDAGERTEQATQQKRDDFRKRGQVVQSREVATFILLLGTCLTVWGMSHYFLGQIVELFNHFFSDTVQVAARENDYAPALMYAGTKVLFVVGPLLAILAVLAFASSVMQIGFLYNEEALQFKTDRINPLNGMKRLMSLRAVVDGAKSFLKLLIVGSIVYMIVRDEVRHISVLVDFSIPQLLTYFGHISIKIMGTVCVFMGIMAAIDYGYQRWEMEKEMRMSKQEIKEEHKSREGDPLIKARIRRVQRDLANKRMMQDVPKADVIITNPTHIAIAIKYENGMAAPLLLAKGADLIAERIKNLAREHKIPIIENKPLARTIYKTMKIGQSIPRELFKAVAEVLAYVYRLKKKRFK